MKLNYIIIPLYAWLVAFVGSRLTMAGMQWYRSITLPSWTPPGVVIGMVWTVLFILGTCAALIVWNRSERGPGFNAIMLLFILNGIINFTWSYLFFYRHLIFAALLDAVALLLSVLGLIFLIRPRSLTAALLLLPYALWVSFAIYLNYVIYRLNI